MRKIILYIILLASMSACKKENNEINTDKIYFSGITRADEEGNLMSAPDTSDWRFDEKWTTLEENLFDTKYSGSDKKCAARISIYPNPVHKIFCLNLENMDEGRLEIRLVDKDFNIIFRYDSIYGTINISPSEINSYDTLRLYFKLIDSQNFEFKGHGDLLIQN